MLFGFNAVTERNKTKNEVVQGRINHRYVSKKCGMNGYKI